MPILRVALAQINMTVGDIDGNVRKIADYLDMAREVSADVVTFPELAIPGYPPEDLLLKPKFIQDNLEGLQRVVLHSSGITAIVGFAGTASSGVHNSAAIIHDGSLAYVYHKIHLPNYGVFDEKRYFQPGRECPVFHLADMVFGVNICEDIWIREGPTCTQALQGGAQIIFNISCSPYHVGKFLERERMLAERARENATIVAYNNLVGGQDELVFDGGSMILNESGNLLARGAQFQEDLLLADVDISKPSADSERPHPADEEPTLRTVELPAIDIAEERPPAPSKERRLLDQTEEVYEALLLGVRDYVHKNGFEKVVLGVSGGIDSALTAVIAADAMGPENVTALSMPSVYSSSETQEDAERLADNLGIGLIAVSINPVFQSYRVALRDEFAGLPENVTEENLQARIRGNILMAFSNKYGWLVLTTGNKSETSVGYCTLYGDSAGGFAVLKDVPKTLVYELAEYRNAKEGAEVIPRSILERAPSAELKADQKDTDSLPPYDILDPILGAYVEEDMSQEDIFARGFDPQTVREVCRLVDMNEYKRRQSPPGIKITPKAFGRDRRMPVTNQYTEF